VNHHHQQRVDRLDVDLIGRAMQRQEDQRQQQRDPELDANRNVGLTEPRQQHHHAADPGKHQHEGGREHGQQ